MLRKILYSDNIAVYEKNNQIDTAFLIQLNTEKFITFSIFDYRPDFLIKQVIAVFKVKRKIN